VELRRDDPARKAAARQVGVKGVALPADQAPGELVLRPKLLRVTVAAGGEVGVVVV
jgi:hypothetical protein